MLKSKHVQNKSIRLHYTGGALLSASSGDGEGAGGGTGCGGGCIVDEESSS